MGVERPSYEVRYGWTLFSASVVLSGTAAFVCLLLVDLPLVARIFFVLACVVGVTPVLVSALSRRVALRVDARGVTFGYPPPLRAVRSALVPWSEITALTVWDRRFVPGIRLPSLSLRRDPALPAVPGTPGAGNPRRVTRIASDCGVAEDLVRTSHQAYSWRLDTQALTAALATFAPDVPLVDARG